MMSVARRDYVMEVDDAEQRKGRTPFHASTGVECNSTGELNVTAEARRWT